MTTPETPQSADRAALRDRIAEAMARADGWSWAAANFSSLSTPATDRYRRCAEEVLAVLPAPVDRAAEVERLRTENDRMRHELEVMYGGAFDSPDRAQSADRSDAARVRALHQQYRSAGDDTTDYCAHCNQISGGWIPWPCPTIQALDAEPRRMADEVQPAERKCTCADAGDCFAPTGHYADCPAVEAQQDGGAR